MKNKLTTTLLVLVLTLPAFASFEELELGIPAMAMGGTGVVLGGIEGSMWNPAAVAAMSTASVTVSGKMPYSNFDFATAGIDGGAPITENWNLAGSARMFGGELYSEQIVAATIAGKLSRDFAFGLQPVLARVDIKDGVSSYGSSMAFSINAGFRVTMYDRWTFAAAVKNPLESRIGNSDEYMHRQLTAGTSYEPAEGLVTAFALSRDFRGTRVRVGGALPLGPLTVFAGAMSGPAVFTGGFSAVVEGIKASYSVQTHPELNLSHAIGVTYAF